MLFFLTFVVAHGYGDEASRTLEQFRLKRDSDGWIIEFEAKGAKFDNDVAKHLSSAPRLETLTLRETLLSDAPVPLPFPIAASSR